MSGRGSRPLSGRPRAVQKRMARSRSTATAREAPGAPEENGAVAVHGIYRALMDAYGPQGWWPLLEVRGCQPTATGVLRGYHPGDFTFPRTDAQRFEICVGAVLTQNTAWPNVEKALANLRGLAALAPERVLALPDVSLADAVRPSGYYRVKGRKLRELAVAYLRFGGHVPARDELLAVWGIGPETADSIRLYAYGQAEMVVDAYTRRVLAALGWVAETAPYGEIKALCERALPRDVAVYQEFHALVVEHAKRCYRRPPWQDGLLSNFARPGH
jgi:endonuclease III related protein